MENYEIINGQVKLNGEYHLQGQVIELAPETAKVLLERKVIRPVWMKREADLGGADFVASKKRYMTEDESLLEMSIGTMCSINKENLVKNIAKQFPAYKVSEIRDFKFDDLIQLILDERRKLAEPKE